jgi:hypothetical protein
MSNKIVWHPPLLFNLGQDYFPVVRILPLTGLAGKRDGREIADTGIEDLNNARVRDKIGLAISRMESLAFRTTFNPVKKLISLA